MEQEERICALEEEVKTLKREIGTTLIEIQKNLPAKSAAPLRWEKRAWVLALLNMLLAVVLFSNIYIYFPDNALAQSNPPIAAWLRALWIALAFVWLLLQMYPLALLLEQDNPQWQGVVWRNAAAFLRARPEFFVLLTLVILAVALIDTIVPAAWFLVIGGLFILVILIAAQTALGSFRKRTRP